jgi:hypothetical protein
MDTNELLDLINTQLGDRAAAIREALEDLRGICGPAAEAWVETEDPPAIELYVVEPGFLHRISGELEPSLDRDEAEEQVTGVCTYEVLPILADARWALSVEVQVNLEGVFKTKRIWTFDGVGGQFQITQDSRSSVKDATPFVQLLSHEITEAQGFS